MTVSIYLMPNQLAYGDKIFLHTHLVLREGNSCFIFYNTIFNVPRVIHTLFELLKFSRPKIFIQVDPQ